MKVEDFNLTEEQINACKSIERAVNKASKLGVLILAKSDQLVAYNKKSYDKGLVAELHSTHLFDYGNPVPSHSIVMIGGSGADDTEFYLKGIFDKPQY